MARCGAEFWRGQLEAWHRSDLTQRDYCATHGLSEKSFYRWTMISATRLAETDFLNGRSSVSIAANLRATGWGVRDRRLYGEGENFLTRNRQLTQAARVEDFPDAMGVAIIMLSVFAFLVFIMFLAS